LKHMVNSWMFTSSIVASILWYGGWQVKIPSVECTSLHCVACRSATIRSKHFVLNCPLYLYLVFFDHLSGTWSNLPCTWIVIELNVQHRLCEFSHGSYTCLDPLYQCLV
jgi:hypothetical protein